MRRISGLQRYSNPNVPQYYIDYAQEKFYSKGYGQSQFQNLLNAATSLEHFEKIMREGFMITIYDAVNPNPTVTKVVKESNNTMLYLGIGAAVLIGGFLILR